MLPSSHLCLHLQPWNHPSVPDKIYEAYGVNDHRLHPASRPTLLVFYHSHDEKYEHYERWVPMDLAYKDFKNDYEDNLVDAYATIQDEPMLYVAVAEAAGSTVRDLFPEHYKETSETEKICQYSHGEITIDNYEEVPYAEHFAPVTGKYTNTNPNVTTSCFGCKKQIPHKGADKPSQSKPVWVCWSLAKGLPCATECLQTGIVCHSCQRQYLLQCAPAGRKGRGRRSRPT